MTTPTRETEERRSVGQGEAKGLYWASALALHTIEQVAPVDATAPGPT